MSALAGFLATLDEAALIAAANKGVVIRARKDAAIKVTLEAQDDTTARLRMDTETITLDAKGLTAGRCSCPAPGLCRHQVTAILFIQDAMASGAAANQHSAEADTGIAAEFTLDEIQRFARADWPLALAMCEEPFEIEAGLSRAVRFPETGESVTFLAGRPLAEALFKGPRSSRQRRAVAAAALILLRDAGTTLPDHIAPEAARAAATPRLLDLAQAGLRQAAGGLASGQVIEAGNRLFTIAISARTEAVPRLAGALRGLSERLDPDRLRRAEDRPEAILGALATAYALTDALRHAPSDPALTGVHARSFTARGPRELVYLGAENWRTNSGARGFTSFLLDPAVGTLHRATDARGAGIDAVYGGEMQWQAMLWSAGTPALLSGKRLTFADLAMAEDGALSLTQTASLTGTASLAELLAQGAVQHDWDALWDHLQALAGQGLRRQRGEVLALIRPEQAEDPVFDPLSQSDLWPWLDAAGNMMTLTLPDSAREITLAPPALGLAAFGAGARPRLIAYWPEGGDAPVSLRDPAARRWKWKPDGSPEPQPDPPAPARHPPDPLERWFDRLLEAILLRLGQRVLAWRQDLIADAETLGLQMIASALRACEGAALTADQALKLAYLADQSRRLCR